MTTLDDLVNKGVIVDQPTDEYGRSFIITGLQRSGTSLVASLLQRAGIFMGSEINDIVFEDEAMARVLVGRDAAALGQFIQQRNAVHARWGFKRPLLWRELGAEQLALFDRPRLIGICRDPVAMAVRTALSEYHDPLQALQDAAANQAAMLAFCSAARCPKLLVSYEKALLFPNDFIDALLRFCAIPDTGDLRGQLLAMVEPNRPRYLYSARRRFDGLIEGVRDGLLYGWCCLTRSPTPVQLDVLVDDRVAMTIVADSFRQDLLDAGFGAGRHGYFVPVEQLQARPDSVIRVRVARHGIELDNSGRRLSEFGTSA